MAKMLVIYKLYKNDDLKNGKKPVLETSSTKELIAKERELQAKGHRTLVVG